MSVLKQEKTSERNGPRLLTGGTLVLRRAPFAAITRQCPQKKRVSKFDEQSRYVIETKGPGKRTKPNKANGVGGKACKASCQTDSSNRPDLATAQDV